jgi:hypothetical protein
MADPGAMRLPSRTESPLRPGLEVADWDYPVPRLATWVDTDGRPWCLGDMSADHLRNVDQYLIRVHGEPWLRTTPLGRALAKVGAEHG